MKKNRIETVVTIALVGIAILLLNPFDFWMPDMMVLSMLAAALVLFGLFASFILREQVGDEREALHRTFAGRNAFLAGAGTLIVAIVVEGYTHTVDPWLVVTLVVMIIVKILTRVWSDGNR
jgi:cytochrome c oxidase assembly factor CtaG